MFKQIVVHKGRTNVVPVSLGYDVSTDTLTSEIREEAKISSTLIATWVVGFVTDGTDGEITLTLDDSATAAITQTKGYMDIKRVSAGEPIPVFDSPIEILFKWAVTQ